eukprot:CAMPEP_0194375650 /NCGR_PEP_ID=MMETSP0174-20130528/24200_1 /TAXON_ID=216777 /ORGANISM="Proboscia alata, Strain PI-D3" /LENGTH=231 /DNA_ID=CAMNT_0039156007 /DNA_START=367 /DNA_END=1061 /DNA_ORIENTATION=+
MSGITTILSKFASSAQENRKMLRQKTFVKSVALRRVVGLASSFFLGGIVSYGAVTRFQSTALSFSALLFLFIAVSEISFTAYQEHVSLFKAASGLWEWGNNDAKQPPTLRYLKQLFRRHNVDGSGYVDEDEFRDILLGASVTNSTDIGLRAVFRSIRAGGTNGVSMEQLIGLVACDGEEDCMMVYDDDDDDDDSFFEFFARAQSDPVIFPPHDFSACVSFHEVKVPREERG